MSHVHSRKNVKFSHALSSDHICCVLGIMLRNNSRSLHPYPARYRGCSLGQECNLKLTNKTMIEIFLTASHILKDVVVVSASETKHC